MISDDVAIAAARLVDIGRRFYARGWANATSGNYSAVVSRDPLRLVITASGADKGGLTVDDFVIVDEAGRPVDATHAVKGATQSPAARAHHRPSAETLLHTTLARRLGVGAVLHTHSVWATVTSGRYYDGGGIELAGYEMEKGLAGFTSHEDRVWVPIFDNTQDIPALARAVEQMLVDQPGPIGHGLLIRRHGLYAWGQDIEEARRHVEALEFLIECHGLQGASPRSASC